jgi:hypothetical protein
MELRLRGENNACVKLAPIQNFGLPNNDVVIGNELSV